MSTYLSFKHLPGRHDQSTHGRRGRGYSDDDLERLATYSSDGLSDDINPWLRGMEPEYADLDDPDERAELERLIASMDRIAASERLPRPLTVYRTVPLSNVNVGDVLSDPAFMSTTTKRGVIEKYRADGGGIALQVELPAGQNAILMSELTRVGAAGEVILPRGTALLIVGMADGFYRAIPAP